MIVLKPIISEKSLGMVENDKYVFKVHLSANKPEITKEIENLYKVKVTGVNIIKVRGENRLSRGRYKIKTTDWKKAIITLKKGDKISGYEIKE